MKVQWILIVLVLFLTWSTGMSQGCSDAGFCTMGAMKPDQHFNRKVRVKLRSIDFTYYKGNSTLTPVIQSATVDLNVGINDKLGIQLKVPYQWVTGTLGDTQGMGDLSVSFTANIYRSDKMDINGTIGGKIPTNDSDLKAENGFTLPMYYQTSLGSYDIVAGMSVLTKNWLFAVGYQQALTSNKNDFTWGEWVRFADREYLSKYDVGIGLRRGTDVMLRAERNFRFTNYSFNFGALGIYRITKDRGIIRTRENGGVPEITGLALSVLAGFTYHLNVSNSVKFIYGYKLDDRATNPDGLTRDDVITATYQVKF